MTNPTNFNLLTYFPILGIITVIAAGWQQVKSFLSRFIHIFWKSRVIPNDFSFDFYQELTKKSLVYNFDNYSMNCESLYSLVDNRFFPVIFKSYSFEILLYKYFIPIFISGQQGERIKISYLKYSFNFDKFLDKVIEVTYGRFKTKNKEFNNRCSFYIQEYRGRSLKEIREKEFSTGSGSEKPMDSSSQSSEKEQFPIIPIWRIINSKLNKRALKLDINKLEYSEPNKKEKDRYQFTEQGKYVLSQVEKWLNAEEFYNERGIRWFRSCCLHSSVGTGKSQLILQIAKKLNIPIFIFFLKTYNDHEFTRDIAGLPSYPSIILFEDIESVWDGRENSKNSKDVDYLNFDCFINKIQGTNSVKGKYLFITTNDLNKLDKAIIRPGRCGDDIVEYKSINKEEKLNLAKVFLDDNKESIDKVMKEGESMSSAEFESLCTREAISNYWDKKN